MCRFVNVSEVTYKKEQYYVRDILLGSHSIASNLSYSVTEYHNNCVSLTKNSLLEPCKVAH
jgi:hypothetical protein